MCNAGLVWVKVKALNLFFLMVKGDKSGKHGELGGFLVKNILEFKDHVQKLFKNSVNSSLWKAVFAVVASNDNLDGE